MMRGEVIAIELGYFGWARAWRQLAQRKREAGDNQGYWAAIDKARHYDAVAYRIQGRADAAARDAIRNRLLEVQHA